MLFFVALRYFSTVSTVQPPVTNSESLPNVLVREASPLNGLPPLILALMALACLGLAAIVAGLTLGLMSLDSTALDIVMKSKDAKQAEAARVIKPIRDQGNLLLVTLLLSNTLAAESLPLILDALVPGGIFSLVASVLSLMLFGEMIPQAVCSRHPLYFGARLIGFVKVLRFIMYPIAAPIAFALDALLGEELGNMYTKDELKNLIDVHAQSKVLTYDETVILKGTLEFTEKTVESIMTPVENVYMLDIDARLDRETMIEILKQGHSRIPLYDTHKNNIVCLLLVKQLIMVNPDEAESVQIRQLISNSQTNHKVRVAPTWECSPSTHISDLLNSFQLGRSHLAMVYDDPLKPADRRKVVGIVTMEDIIEEILQEEIIDETDLFVDNTNSQRRLILNSNGRLVYSPPPGPTPPSSEHETAARTIRVREIDVHALRRPILENFVSSAGASSSSVALRSMDSSAQLQDVRAGFSDSAPAFSLQSPTHAPPNASPDAFLSHNAICSPDAMQSTYGDDLEESASLSEPALDRKLRRHLSRRESAERRRRLLDYSTLDSGMDMSSAADNSKDEKAKVQQTLVGSDFEMDLEVDEPGHEEDRISSKNGESDSSDLERTALLQRNSADNVTGETRTTTIAAVNKQASVAAFVRRSSRMGPMLGGVARRSMMSLMDDENSVMPEDVARAEHQPPYYLLRKTPRASKPNAYMRPVPNYASTERTEIPDRHRRSPSIRRPDAINVAAIATPTASKLVSTHLSNSTNYGAIESSDRPSTLPTLATPIAAAGNTAKAVVSRDDVYIVKVPIVKVDSEVEANVAADGSAAEPSNPEGIEQV